MRGMAGKASLFTRDRDMIDGYLLAFFLMAIKTEKISSLSNKVRVFRSMRSVTSNTFSFFKRTMLDISAGF
jgi:hypothetical protein